MICQHTTVPEGLTYQLKAVLFSFLVSVPLRTAFREGSRWMHIWAQNDISIQWAPGFTLSACGACSCLSSHFQLLMWVHWGRLKESEGKGQEFWWSSWGRKARSLAFFQNRIGYVAHSASLPRGCWKPQPVPFEMIVAPAIIVKDGYMCHTVQTEALWVFFLFCTCLCPDTSQGWPNKSMICFCLRIVTFGGIPPFRVACFNLIAEPVLRQSLLVSTQIHPHLWVMRTSALSK